MSTDELGDTEAFGFRDGLSQPRLAGLPRDPANSFALLDSYFKKCAALQPARPVVLILPFAETVVPMTDPSSRGPEDRTVLVYLRKWAQDPVLRAWVERQLPTLRFHLAKAGRALPAAAARGQRAV